MHQIQIENNSFLIDKELFGNEAGEDEDLNVLSSYFLEKVEFDSFYSSSNRLQFVRSKKGVGKSALLKYTQYKQELSSPDSLVIYAKGADLVSLYKILSNSPNDLINGWQQRICAYINHELGKRIKVAFNDDAICLVEGAEIAGFKGRNLVSALIDRFKLKLNLSGNMEIETKDKIASTDSAKLLERYSSKRSIDTWLLVDDIDATFINTKEESICTSTFFSACRNLVNNVSGLNIRAAVRTDVWSILKQKDESLDKCEQYMLDLKWSTRETGMIIGNKLLSYWRRKAKSGEIIKVSARSRKEISYKVFTPIFKWGKNEMEPYRPIHILCAGRPRWATQLCRMAGKDAYKKKNSRISIGNISSIMMEYGQMRLDDLYREHGHQCDNIKGIVETFAGGNRRYTTRALLERITNNVIRLYGIPRIDGISSAAGSIAVAHFLYRIGFIHARYTQGEQPGFVRYEDRPNLLTTKVNLDDGMDWEIHPSYRQVLKIYHERNEGFEYLE